LQKISQKIYLKKIDPSGHTQKSESIGWFETRLFEVQKLEKGECIMAKKNSIVEFVVTDNAGNVDVEASKEVFRTALQNYVSVREGLLSKAAAAVHAVFDENVGEAFKIPVLVGIAMRNLPYTPETFEEYEDAVDAYIHASSDLLIKKGPTGGVRRVCDIK
jgi:hypothetical protein